MLVRRPLLAIAVALSLFGVGGVLLAQMESAERGILPVDSSGTLEIGGIAVDVGGKNAEDARFNGWRVAQREGFRALWAKTNKRLVGEAPNLSDSTLDGLVSSIVVEREQIGPNRYIATLGILFDRTRAGELLGIGGPGRRSAPMLLIPVMVTGGAATSVELRNPWQRAWAQFRTSQSQIDYVRVSGLQVDPLLVNAAQATRPGRGWWRNILDLYGAANVMVAEVHLSRLYPGGPAKALFIARFGPDNRSIGRFELTAKDSADVPRMMSEGVQRIDDLYTQALAVGIVRGDPDLIVQPPPPIVEEETAADTVATPIVPMNVIQVLVTEREDGAVGQTVAQIRSLGGVQWVTQGPLPGGGANLAVNFRGDISALATALSSRGWSVTNSGGLLRVTRGAAPPPAAPSSPNP